MTVLSPAPRNSPSWKIAVGAEGIAAAQFARCGIDVSFQSGLDKPGYALVVTKAGMLLKVAVMGSEDGQWDLTQPYLKRAAELSRKNADSHRAIDLWLDHHSGRTVCCLVQFQAVELHELPRIYLAFPGEVAQMLHQTCERLGTPILFEHYEWTSLADRSQIAERLPARWRFSDERILELLMGAASAAKPAPQLQKDSPTDRIWLIPDTKARAVEVPRQLTA